MMFKIRLIQASTGCTRETAALYTRRPERLYKGKSYLSLGGYRWVSPVRLSINPSLSNILDAGRSVNMTEIIRRITKGFTIRLSTRKHFRGLKEMQGRP